MPKQIFLLLTLAVSFAKSKGAQREFSELLTRAKAAIEHAREQVHKTHTLLAESKAKRGSETMMGRDSRPR